jgi:hypothetical protein
VIPSTTISNSSPEGVFVSASRRAIFSIRFDFPGPTTNSPRFGFVRQTGAKARPSLGRRTARHGPRFLLSVLHPPPPAVAVFQALSPAQVHSVVFPEPSATPIFFTFGQRFLVARPTIRLSSSFLLPCFGPGFRSNFPVQTPILCSTSPRAVFVVAAVRHSLFLSRSDFGPVPQIRFAVASS